MSGRERQRGIGAGKGKSFDVIPEPLLTVFDYQELELLMCGMPQIDMEDWKENTMYSGEFSDTGPDNDAVFWFWEVVDDFVQAHGSHPG